MFGSVVCWDSTKNLPLLASSRKIGSKNFPRLWREPMVLLGAQPFLVTPIVFSYASTFLYKTDIPSHVYRIIAQLSFYQSYHGHYQSINPIAYKWLLKFWVGIVYGGAISGSCSAQKSSLPELVLFNLVALLAFLSSLFFSLIKGFRFWRIMAVMLLGCLWTYGMRILTHARLSSL